MSSPRREHYGFFTPVSDDPLPVCDPDRFPTLYAYLAAIYHPNVWAQNWYYFAAAIFTWVSLHFTVPLIASQVLRDQTHKSMLYKCMWRCILSLFPLDRYDSPPSAEAHGGHERSLSHEALHKKTDAHPHDSPSHPSTSHAHDTQTQLKARLNRRFSAFQVTAQLIALHIQRKHARQKGLPWIVPKWWLETQQVYIELLISALLPYAVSSDTGDSHDHLALMLAPHSLFSVLLAYRLIAPLSHAVRTLVEDTVANMNEKVNHGKGLAYLAQRSFLPTLVTGLLWTVWGLFAAHSIGIDVSDMVKSLGLSGMLFTLSLQSYAADVVGSVTLLAERRFSTGDMIRFGSDKDYYLVDYVGLLSTRVRCFEGGRYYVYVPNSVLVKAMIVNASRIKQRRLTPTVYVDPLTPIAKLRPMPQALLQAVKDATAEFHGVIYIQEDKGLCCELRGMTDPMGLRFELKVVLAQDPKDTLRWKRFETAANIAMLEYLQDHGIRPGCVRHQRETTADMIGGGVPDTEDVIGEAYDPVDI